MVKSYQEKKLAILLNISKSLEDIRKEIKRTNEIAYDKQKSDLKGVLSKAEREWLNACYGNNNKNK